MEKSTTFKVTPKSFPAPVVVFDETGVQRGMAISSRTAGVNMGLLVEFPDGTRTWVATWELAPDPWDEVVESLAKVPEPGIVSRRFITCRKCGAICTNDSAMKCFKCGELTATAPYASLRSCLELLIREARSYAPSR